MKVAPEFRMWPGILRMWPGILRMVESGFGVYKGGGRWNLRPEFFLGFSLSIEVRGPGVTAVQTKLTLCYSYSWDPIGLTSINPGDLLR